MGTSKPILTFAISLFIFFNAYAQTASLEGTIVQSDSNLVLSGVSVYLEHTNIGATTNSKGFYFIKDVPTGRYTLVVSSIGYFTLKQKIHILTNERLKANFSMIESISSLSEVTVITGGSNKVKDIPGSVHYISPKEIEKFSYTDINKTLRAVPGVNIQEEEGFGLRPNIGLRGTGVERSAKITIMEDGILTAPAPYAAPAAYYFPTIGRMQAVEILKGSSQIKFGPYTTGGAINLISTQIPNQFSGRFSLMAGNYNIRNLHGYIGNAHNHFGYMVEALQYSSKGFKDIDKGGNSGFDKKDFIAKFRVNTKDVAKIKQSLLFKTGHSTETSNQSYLGLTQQDYNDDPFRLYAAVQKDEMNTKQYQYSLSYTVKFPKLVKITTTAYKTDFKRNWYKVDAVKDSSGTKIKIGDLVDSPSDYENAYNILTGGSSLNNEVILVKANNRRYYGMGAQTIVGFNFKTGSISHDIDVSFRYHQDQIDRFQWVDEYAMFDGKMGLVKAGVHGTESNRVETAYAMASYVQYKFKFRKFTAIPGIRNENITIEREDYGTNDPDRTGENLTERSNKVNVFIPGIGLDYQFNTHISIFGGLHKGFSPPGSTEGTIPEESINYELGLRFAKKAFTGDVVLFYNDFSNLLGADLAAAGGGGTTEQYNGGEVKSNGVELQFLFDPLYFKDESKFSLPISFTYTYTHARFQNSFDSEFGGWGEVSAGDHLPYLADNQFTIIISLEHHKFGINISGRYTGEMRTSPSDGEIPENEMICAHFIIDVSANYMLHKNIALFGTCTNLLNKKYPVARRPAGLRPGMPLAFLFGLKANF